MSKMQREKGAAFEREVCAYLTTQFPTLAPDKIKRKLGQPRDSGNDIDFGPLVIECKRRAQMKGLYDWVDQATRAAAGMPPVSHGMRVPLVIARSDGHDMLAVLPLPHLLWLAAPQLVQWFERNKGTHPMALPSLRVML